MSKLDEDHHDDRSLFPSAEGMMVSMLYAVVNEDIFRLTLLLFMGVVVWTICGLTLETKSDT
ncbi:hypothetical protein L228DRAFT_271267 [Xylona heveae TC161]|uniref:Uncharacterized protein n=1 Tax=Xylona heveae (strain CBS 132557 / TC161) TaxID=1328760 RepID=A0A164ZSY1_XYLHT|nr:hypothetical protein L228DRAFT_271267 [Xylona heveae TC161]KZF19470.1 hypothetical protein L228DRAFT_271267 [Xylona heveae TC161]